MAIFKHANQADLMGKRQHLVEIILSNKQLLQIKDQCWKQAGVR